MKQASKLLAATLAAALSLAAYGQQSSAQQQGSAAKPMTVQGSIESIDREAESLSLKAAEDGRITMMRLDRSLPNFDKLEKGDKVTARYTEAVLLSAVRSDGPAQPTADAPPSAPDTGAAAVTPPPGAEPSRMMAKVTDLDAAAGKVTLQAPKGEEIRMNVRDKEALTGLKKGDEVVATYIEARALSVVPQDDPQGSR
jgi:Cu/Ag efflux protein CusF